MADTTEILLGATRVRLELYDAGSPERPSEATRFVLIYVDDHPDDSVVDRIPLVVTTGGKAYSLDDYEDDEEDGYAMTASYLRISPTRRTSWRRSIEIVDSINRLRRADLQAVEDDHSTYAGEEI